MEHSVEKSCWGITLWAIAVVVALALLLSLFSRGEPSASLPVITSVST